jgi:hypothetical protein
LSIRQKQINKRGKNKMELLTYMQEMEYLYYPERKGAKYKIGDTFKNRGELCESISKFKRGLPYLVNPRTDWWQGSDIESLQASVKSSRCSVATIEAETYEKMLDIYFSKVPSILWIYVTIINNIVYEYHMNAAEFRKFLERWGSVDRESGTHKKKIRVREENDKMLQWLNERV